MTSAAAPAPVPTLFEPVQLGPLRLRNRVVMAPMTRRFSPGGVPGPGVADYYVRRAEGGVGLVMTEGLEIGHRTSVHHASIPNFYEPDALAGWYDIARRVQAAGAAFVPQFWHVGSYRSVAEDVKDPGAGAVSPSGMYREGERDGEPATSTQIEEVVGAYAEAARAAFEMNCDGIELHAGHGYLIDQFLWSGTNERDDRYGGSPEARARFGCEVVAACRRSTSATFPIFFRFSQWKIQDYGARLFPTPADLEGFLTQLVAAGVDVFDCSTRRFWEPEFDGSDLTLAGWTRLLSGRPTMTVGSVGLDNDVVDSLHGGAQRSEATRLEDLHRMLARGDFDLVGVGRALIADPAWARKVERGAFADLRGFSRTQLDTLV